MAKLPVIKEKMRFTNNWLFFIAIILLPLVVLDHFVMGFLDDFLRDFLKHSILGPRADRSLARVLLFFLCFVFFVCSIIILFSIAARRLVFRGTPTTTFESFFIGGLFGTLLWPMSELELTAFSELQNRGMHRAIACSSGLKA